MKTRTLLLGAVASLALGATANATTIDGWYVSLEGGANWVEDWDQLQFPVPGPGVPLTAIASFDTGWAVLASVGYGWRHWRLEFEAGWRENDLDTYVRSGGVVAGATGDLSEASLMVNVLYDIPVTERVTFSLGAGAGGDFAEFEAGLPPPPTLAADSWSFAYQGIAGLSYDVGPRTALFVNYRYFRVSNPEFDYSPAIAARLEGDDIVKHTATIGLRYALGAEPAPAPMAEAVAPPPPMPPEISRQFIIFFGFNKCNITGEADGVLGQAADAARQTGSAAISIVGHTDTSGSTKHNQKLSVCRANAAKTNLVGKGIAAGSINASGRGEGELLVQTADGVKEPQNRRAQVDLQ